MACSGAKRTQYIILSVSVVICVFIFSRPSVQRLLFGACACGQCMSDIAHDTWFQKHFDPYAQPLLTKHNCILSNALYWWWQVSALANIATMLEICMQIQYVIP